MKRKKKRNFKSNRLRLMDFLQYIGYIRDTKLNETQERFFFNKNGNVHYTGCRFKDPTLVVTFCIYVFNKA